MTRPKQRLYENRHGLFFFMFLVVYCCLDLSNIYYEADAGITYSIYCMDFSFGFCSRLLPGAIFNLLFENITPEKVMMYIRVLLLLCFLCASLLISSFLKKFDKNFKQGFICALFGSVVIFECFNIGDLFGLLDFHWIIGLFIFMLALSNKWMYFAIPLAFIYVIMSHYGSMICYVPLFALLLFIKIKFTSVRSEKISLTVIASISIVISAGLFIYLLMFELDNFNVTLEELNQFFNTRGITETDYYAFPFFRETAGIANIVDDIDIDSIIKIDYNRSKILIMLQTVINQIQVNLLLWDHAKFIYTITTFLPLLVFIYKILIKEAKKSKNCLCIIAILLPIFTIVCGFFMSTDTVRWISHGIIVLLVSFMYLIHYDKSSKENYCNSVLKIPEAYALLYLIICATYIFIN